MMHSQHSISVCTVCLAKLCNLPFHLASMDRGLEPNGVRSQVVVDA